MVEYGCRICPDCGGDLKRYDRCYRFIRIGYGKKVTVVLGRYYCILCGKIHRELTKRILPHYRYDKRIVMGFREGRYKTCMDAFEDYPCEVTVELWLRKSA